MTEGQIDTDLGVVADMGVERSTTLAAAKGAPEENAADEKTRATLSVSNLQDLSYESKGGHLNEVVTILRFKRFDKFRQVFLEGTEFKECRDALEANGFSMDLAEYGLGLGKLIVRPHLAAVTLGKLRDLPDYASLCYSLTSL